MGKMFLMCGLSGAGKTTFAKKFAEENGYVYLSIDNIYRGLSANYDDLDDSFSAWIYFFKLIHGAEMAGHDVVIDTNAPTFVKRAQFIDWFPSFEEHNLIYIKANRDLRRRNNAARDRVVPDDEMERMEEEFESPIAYYSFGIKSGYYIEDNCNWDNIQAYLNDENVLKEIPICNN